MLFFGGAAGAVKAWKRHRAQTQNVAVPVGRIRLVVYDDRQGSSTRGRVQQLELGRPDAYLRLRIPPGLWYGFSCISPTPALLANCADLPHDPADGEVLALNDPAIHIHGGWHRQFMRVLITGGFGYVGGRLAQFLAFRGTYEILLDHGNKPSHPHGCPRRMWCGPSGTRRLA